MPRKRRWLVVPLVFGALTLAANAHAEDRDLERARALFDEAGELEKHGQWAAAQERLRAAIRIHETPHLRYALGWALENDDKVDAARTEYETALRLAQTSRADEVSRLVSARLAELDRKRAAAGSAGTSGGAKHAGSGEALPWVLLGGGAVLGIGAAVLFVSSASDASTRDESQRRWCEATACTNGVTPTRAETAESAAYRKESMDAADRGNTKQIVGGVLAGVGLVSLAFGTYLVLRHPGERADTKGANVRVGAAPMTGGALAGAAFTW